MIELLQRKHNRSEFACGESALDKYLKQLATQHAKSGVSRTFVVADESDKVQAFYTLNMGSIDKNLLPVALQKRFPHHPLPIVRLGCLAVNKEQQGKGLGKQLLVHALHKCYLLSKEIGMIAIIIDAKDDNAKRFYLQYEFESLPNQSLTLWLPVGALKQLFS